MPDFTDGLSFEKMSGSGNDFIVIDNRQGQVPQTLDPDWVRRLCQRRLSVGADGLILIEKHETADFCWRFFNADGSVAEMCGNGARCAARFAHRHGIAGEKMTFETVAGRIGAQMLGERVKLRMTPPTGLQMNRQLALDGERLPFHQVNTGVPHAIFEVKELEEIDVKALGAGIRHHNAFAPAGTNVNFIMPAGDGSYVIRTYERGVEDETLACGTGVVAAAIVINRLHNAPAPLDLRPRGGGFLRVSLDQAGDEITGACLEGDARLVYSAELNAESVCHGD